MSIKIENKMKAKHEPLHTGIMQQAWLQNNKRQQIQSKTYIISLTQNSPVHLKSEHILTLPSPNNLREGVKLYYSQPSKLFSLVVAKHSPHCKSYQPCKRNGFRHSNHKTDYLHHLIEALTWGCLGMLFYLFYYNRMLFVSDQLSIG